MPIDPQNDVTFRIENIPAMAALEIAWRELREDGAGSFFTSWHWIGTWLQTLPCQIEPQLIRALRGSATVGLAIAVFTRSKRHLLVDTRQLHFNSTGNNAYDGITIERNDFAGETGLLPIFIDWFAESNCADELIIRGTSPENVPPVRGLLRTVREMPCFANLRLAEIGLNGIGTLLSRNARQQLNRSMRDFSRFGTLRIEEAASPAVALTWFDMLKALHVKSWTRRGKRHAFATPYFEAFHCALLSSGAGQLLRVTAGEHIVGYLYNLRRGATIHAYQSGFSYEEGNDRPGYVCHALAMEHCARHAATEYDFLAGDNRLKRSFGTTQYVLCWATFSRPTLTLRLEAALRALRGPTQGTRSS